MAEEKKSDWLRVVLLLLMGFVLYVMGVGTGVSFMHCESIKFGVAEWRVDPKTGATRFEYIKGNAAESAEEK